MKNILKQTSWLVIAQTLGRAIGFLYTIFLARNLGVEDFGIYSVALAYFSLLSIISDFGFNRFLIREIAVDKTKLPQLLWNISLLRLTLTVILYASFAVGLYILDNDKLRVNLVLLASLAVIPQAVSLTIDAIFIAMQRLQLASVSLVLLSLVSATLGLYFVSSGLGTYGAVLALILGQAIYLLSLIYFLNRENKIKFVQINSATLKEIFLGSLPYGILGILGLLYFKIDILLLTYIRGNFDAGIYGASFKFLEALVFVPSALSAALFPIFARLHEGDSSKIGKLYFKSIGLMLILGIFIATGYWLILPPLINLYLPNYNTAIEVIKILSLTIPLMFIHVPGAQVLLSTDKFLKPILVLSILTLAFNIILNLIFIPQYGVKAAAWVTVLSELLSFIVFFLLLRSRVLK